MSFVNLQRRTSIVTGAAGGIGQAVCEELARAGSGVALFDLESAKADEVAASLAKEFRVAAKNYVVDIRDNDNVARAVGAVAVDFGAIDHLINAHGIQFLSPFGDFPQDRWALVQDINLQGLFRTTQAVWSHMLSRKRGRVVNISSVHGLVASELKSAYVTAKHGVVGLTRASAIEGAEHGITVNAVCPGAVLTDLVVRQGQDYVRKFGGGMSEKDALERAFLDAMPTRRFIEPAEIGQLCAYLCSDAACSITGTAIPIDGGWTAR